MNFVNSLQKNYNFYLIIIIIIIIIIREYFTVSECSKLLWDYVNTKDLTLKENPKNDSIR